MNYLAHAGHDHETTEVTSSGLLDSLTHQPTWISLLIIAFVLFGVYVIFEKLKVTPINRILLMMPLLILIGILYLDHNPFVTTTVLSLGFVAAFFLAFVQLSGNKALKNKKGPKSNDAGNEQT